jgi:hypothetical protein
MNVVEYIFRLLWGQIYFGRSCTIDNQFRGGCGVELVFEWIIAESEVNIEGNDRAGLKMNVVEYIFRLLWGQTYFGSSCTIDNQVRGGCGVELLGLPVDYEWDWGHYPGKWPCWVQNGRCRIYILVTLRANIFWSVLDHCQQNQMWLWGRAVSSSGLWMRVRSFSCKMTVIGSKWTLWNIYFCDFEDKHILVSAWPFLANSEVFGGHSWVFEWIMAESEVIIEGNDRAGVKTDIVEYIFMWLKGQTYFGCSCTMDNQLRGSLWGRAGSSSGLWLRVRSLSREMTVLGSKWTL